MNKSKKILIGILCIGIMTLLAIVSISTATAEPEIIKITYDGSASSIIRANNQPEWYYAYINVSGIVNQHGETLLGKFKLYNDTFTKEFTTIMKLGPSYIYQYNSDEYGYTLNYSNIPFNLKLVNEEGIFNGAGQYLRYDYSGTNGGDRAVEQINGYIVGKEGGYSIYFFKIRYP